MTIVSRDGQQSSSIAAPATPLAQRTKLVRREHPRYVADFSLALANRTGAYFACREIIRQLPHLFAGTRYWRAIREAEPRGVLRKLMCKAMYTELDYVGVAAAKPWPRPRDLPTLFMDPLYVRHAGLAPHDIVLCHDVGPITHPSLFGPGAHSGYSRAYRLIRQTRPTMVFVSEASRRAFIALYGDDYPSMHVIPLFVREDMAHGPQQPPAGVARPFMLTVGAFDHRKNHVRALKAFAQSGLADHGYSYVLCGPKGNASGEVDEMGRNMRGVVKLGYLTDAELRWLYRNATAFVLPSLIEGFGLPALEAAQHGLISIVSAGGAQEEAVGKSGILVDPLSVGSIADGMRRSTILDAHHLTSRRELARAHAEAHSLRTFCAEWATLLERSNA